MINTIQLFKIKFNERCDKNVNISFDFLTELLRLKGIQYILYSMTNLLMVNEPTLKKFEMAA